MLVFKRPIVYIDYKEKIHNTNEDKIYLQTIEEEFKDVFGNVLNVENLKELPNLCENLINDNTVSTELVESFEKKYLSNLNNSAKFAAKYLVDKLKI